jgi:hypothetical protein
MVNRKLVKQLIDFHKKSFENCFSVMVTLQLQAENIFNFFHYLPIISEEGKKLIRQHTDDYKKWIDDLKKAMDEGYAKIEAFYNHNAVAALHDQTKKLFNAHLHQTSWMPHDLRKTLKQMETIYKKGCDEFQKYVDENMRSIQNCYSTQKKQTKTGKRSEFR